MHETNDRAIRKYPFLPADAELGWMPYLWLVYLGFFTIDPIVSDAGLGEWLLFAGMLAVFLPLYFLGFWARTPTRLLLVVGAITLLGIVYLPYNLSSWGLFIYAGAYLGFGLRPGRALAVLGALCGVIVTEGILLGLAPWAIIAATGMTAIVGASNVHFAEVNRKNEHLKAAREEVERLAQSAERERIGRDLHDLLGHTLTLIAVKAELAAKLADRDPERSREEIREVHRISRHALQEVRRAVQGYRAGTSAGLARELSSARGTLESAEVELDLRVSDEAVEALAAAGPEREAAIALALREAVTNVLRHAQARTCRVALSEVTGTSSGSPLAPSIPLSPRGARRTPPPDPRKPSPEVTGTSGKEGRIRLVVDDDGRGGGTTDGAGLDGMRQRIEALGGTVRRRSEGGTRLTVELPVPPLAAAAVPEAAEADRSAEPRTSPAPA